MLFIRFLFLILRIHLWAQSLKQRAIQTNISRLWLFNFFANLFNIVENID